jgi:hypothetical protein
MKKMKGLVSVEFYSLIALLSVSAAMAGYCAIESTLHSNSMLGPWQSAQVGFGFTAIIGLPFVVFFGAPIYYFLASRGKAFWPQVLLLGIVPSLLLFAIDYSMGFFATICGASIAAFTHILCRKWALTTQSSGTSV